MAGGSWQEQLVEDSRWCQYRGPAAMQEKHSAAHASSTKQRPDRSRRRVQGRQRSCQPGGEQNVHQKATMKRVRAPSQAVMKHVPNGREERKAARDGTQGLVKESAVPTAGKWKSLCPDGLWFDCASNGEGCV